MENQPDLFKTSSPPVGERIAAPQGRRSAGQVR